MITFSINPEKGEQLIKEGRLQRLAVVLHHPSSMTRGDAS
jgi:hypothetical protein